MHVGHVHALLCSYVDSMTQCGLSTFFHISVATHVIAHMVHLCYFQKKTQVKKHFMRIHGGYTVGYEVPTIQ